MHTQEGIQRIHTLHPNNAGSVAAKQKSLKSKNEYSKQPNKCLKCLNNLQYEKRHNKFCSKSCAASYNNIQRDPRSDDSRKKVSNAVKISWPNRPPVAKKYSKVSWCKICNTVIRFSHRKTCSKECHSLLMSEYQKRINHSGGHQSKRQYYESPSAGKVFLESSWEVLLAQSLDKFNINWIRPKYLNYTLNNKRKSYYPDFYLPDYDVYLDPKNDYQRLQDAAKIAAVIYEHNIRLFLLSKKECDWNILKHKLVGMVGVEPTSPSGDSF